MENRVSGSEKDNSYCERRKKPSDGSKLKTAVYHANAPALFSHT
jgi:hypothetical protein